MLYNYTLVSPSGEQSKGSIEAISADAAIATLQKKGLIVYGIQSSEQKSFDLFGNLTFLNHVSTKDIVMLSRQMATLFQAQVSALRIFRLLAAQVENKLLQKYLFDVVDDLQGGSTISNALAKHPDAFSDFYVNMVKSGEESGKLDETFGYLADYLERSYSVVSKAKSALIYPAFVIATFIGVMVVMMTFIIPKISLMLADSGQELPIYTKIVLGISNVFVHYGLYLGIGAVILGFFIWKYIKTPEGSSYYDKLVLDVPYIGTLYRKLYLSRIADNLNTMISSGIPILRALEITAAVVDNNVFKNILEQSIKEVKGGNSLSNAFGAFSDVPSIMVQMIKVGEESGELGSILKTLANFYEREVVTAVDTLVSLIEPVMIVALGLGVGVLMASVLMPIYNIAGGAA
jgi:type IV pilus assembly protein PilC